ncbi:type II toxin-antitoxin system HicA family toxin [Candidatus Symbiothrix dinenymphae]|uniref:type II toxin-antitoxin system HicA family toxin n=1 Tax=Candidatus Symbiothrix dinenymphae TaxID=467085 RepID=UPI0006E1F95C|nr:type II toxin-antitoxin system HicA family toxin [Candidatus Symbiothrix dinenymphae]
MKGSEVLRKLTKNGCFLDAQGSKHGWWYSPMTDLHFPVPRHPSQEIASGTLQNISKLSGVKF